MFETKSIRETCVQLDSDIDKGLTEKERMSLLGVYGGEYRLLTNVPVAIASSLGTSMIPSIVASKTQRDFPAVQKKIRLTVKFNMLIAIPCAVGMGVLAGPVMQLIFGDHSALARDLLTIGAPAVIFFSLSTVDTAADNVVIKCFFQPRNDRCCIKSARICKNNFFFHN